MARQVDVRPSINNRECFQHGGYKRQCLLASLAYDSTPRNQHDFAALDAVIECALRPAKQIYKFAGTATRRLVAMSQSLRSMGHGGRQGLRVVHAASQHSQQMRNRRLLRGRVKCLFESPRPHASPRSACPHTKRLHRVFRRAFMSLFVLSLRHF